MTYIVLIHLLVGHFRRKTFPLNDVMFSGSVPVEKLAQEKPDWLNRLERENRFAQLAARPPALWYRALYFVFGYAVIALGLYIVVAGVYYSQFIQLH